MGRLVSLLLFLIGLAVTNAACKDAAPWCGDYKDRCSESHVQTNCKQSCGLCGTGGTGVSAECGKGSPKYPPSLRFKGDEILGVAHGISGGYEASPHSYPFLAALGGPWGKNGQGATCTASIISDQWILTAAHCVATDDQKLKIPPSDYWVRVGSQNRNDGKVIKAKKVIFHEDYYGGCKQKGTDIAVVQLAEKIQFGDEIQPVCLPSAQDNFIKDGMKMVAAGWGLTNADQSGLTQSLQHGVFNTKASCYWQHKSKEMCAWGGFGSAACSGDSGGPLFFKQNGKWTQTGIAECGGGTCASENQPSIYVHVPAHREWIKRKTGL